MSAGQGSRSLPLVLLKANSITVFEVHGIHSYHFYMVLEAQGQSGGFLVYGRLLDTFLGYPETRLRMSVFSFVVASQIL